MRAARKRPIHERPLPLAANWCRLRARVVLLLLWLSLLLLLLLLLSFCPQGLLLLLLAMMSLVGDVKDGWRPKEDVAPHPIPEFPTPDITLVPLEYRWLNPGERVLSLYEFYHPLCRQYFHSQVFCLHTPQHNNTFDNFHGAAPRPSTPLFLHAQHLCQEFDKQNELPRRI